jgi:hypothetical protein
MNKKSNSNHLRAPTMQPSTSITPSSTLTADGESPLSAANGLSAPEPLANHDVLQAALANDVPVAASAEPVADAVALDTPADPMVAEPGGRAKKHTTKQIKAAPPVKPVKPAKVPKIKFVEVTFALPESEAELLAAMKKTHQANGLALKKGQLLRAGLLALADIDSDRLAQLVAHLPAEPRASKKKK